MSDLLLEHEHEGTNEVNLHIIVTPMLDMAFQLLAFFIMTFHPSGMEAYINGKLLPPEKVAVKGAKPKEPSTEVETVTDVEPEINEVVTVVVKAVQPNEETGSKLRGEPTEILIRLPESPDPERIADASDSFENGLKKLYERLKEVRKSQAGGKSLIKLNPDGGLKHGYVVRVWDTCRASGYPNIGFIPPAPPQK